MKLLYSRFMLWMIRLAPGERAKLHSSGVPATVISVDAVNAMQFDLVRAIGAEDPVRFAAVAQERSDNE